MKKQDIQAGVVYGFAQGTSEYRNAHPTIVLDAKGLWTWYRGSGQSRQWKVSGEKRFTSGSGGWSSWHGPHGYLVLHGNRYSDEKRQAQNLAKLRALYEEFARSAGNPDAVKALASKVMETDGISLDVVNNRWITGDYVETKNEEAEREASRQAQHKAERDRSAAEHALLAEVAEAIGTKLETEVFVHGERSWGYTRASIKLDDLAAFFGLKTVRERL